MTHRDDGLPIYTEAEQGVADDLRVPSEAGQRSAQSAAIYAGSRTSLVEGLRSGKFDSGVELVTPEMLRRRATVGRAGIYLRVSTEEQARVGGGAEGYSIPYQREATRRKAAELGLPVLEEYPELGYTGTTTRRPEFQRLLRDLESGKISHVIVHKLDRLSRSKKADYAIDMAIENAGAHIVSVAEHVDDTPAGKLNLQMYRGMAHYYSNNLATEVVKGLTTKLDQGGTPGQAPLGYLNKREIRGSADVRWVEVDPERGPLMRWAFEEYATGDWTLSSLADILEAKGLTTRAGPKRPSKTLGIGSLHKLLTNPYFVGIIAYKGVYHQGSQEPLVTMDTWLRVQDVLAAHNFAGEKDRRHPHYLKGSIWCGGCGMRLVYSRNTGKSGGTYEYFFCMGKKDRNNPCPRRYVKLAAVEAGVIDFYSCLQLTQERADKIRIVVREELASSRDTAARDIAGAKQQKQKVERERAKLLEAHYIGAIPLDMLKREMDRLTRELNNAETAEAAAKLSLTDLDQQLERALDIAQHCARLYEVAKPPTRRMMNQGFFSRLYIAEDGTVEDAELQEPFVQLLARDEHTTIDERKARVRRIFGEGVVDVDEAAETTTQTGGHEMESVSELRRRSESGVLLSFHRHKQTRPKLSFRSGSNELLLAEDRGFEPLRALTQPAFQASAIGH